MRVSYRLSDSCFKLSVSKSEAQDFNEANRLVNKAIQYFNCYQEFFEKYSETYESLKNFVYD